MCRIRLIFLFGIVGMGSSICASGQTIIDSIQKALQADQSGITRVDLLNDLAWEYLEVDPAQGLQYAHKALKLSKEIRYYDGTAYALGNVAVLYEVMGEYANSMEYYIESLNLYQRMKDSVMGNTIRHNIAILLGQVGDHETSLDYYKKTLAYDSLHGRKSDLLIDFLNIGATYRELRKPSLARYYYHKGLHAARKQKFEGDHFFNNLASLYLAEGNIDSAGFYIHLSQRNESGQYRKLYETYDLLNLGEYLVAINLLDSAKKCIDDGFTLAKGKNYADGILKGLLATSKYYDANGEKGKALSYFHRYAEFKDSLLDIRRKARVDIVEQRLRIDDSERIIANLETERQLELNRSRTLIIGFTLVVLVSVFTVILLWQIRMKNLKLSERNAVIEDQLIEIKALAKESHHRIKNNLQVVSSLLKLQSNNVQHKAAKAALSEAYGRVRTIALIHQKLYKEDSFSKVDLQEFMQQLLSNISTSMGNEHMITIQQRIPSLWMKVDAAIFIGLIVNELVTNSFKYAFNEDEQGEVHVEVEEEGSTLQIKVRDNGAGYPEELLVEQQASFGLSIVKSLLRIFKGDLEVYNENGAVSKVLLNEVEILKEE